MERLDRLHISGLAPKLWDCPSKTESFAGILEVPTPLPEKRVYNPWAVSTPTL